MLPFLIPLLNIISINWNKIRVCCGGKHIAILGERGVGKTHLLSFLLKGEIPEKYEQTVGDIRSSGAVFKLRDLELVVRKTTDVSGSKDAYSSWKKIHDQADYVFYLLRVDKVLSDDKKTIERIAADIEHIRSWKEQRNDKGVLYYIIGTHCDYDPAFRHLTRETQGKYHDDFINKEIIQTAMLSICDNKHTRVIIGSMLNKECMQSLTYELLCRIQSDCD